MSAAGCGLTDEEMNDLLSGADTQGPDGTDDQPAEEAGPGPEALERAQRGSIADAVAAGTHADDDPLIRTSPMMASWKSATTTSRRRTTT